MEIPHLEFDMERISSRDAEEINKARVALSMDNFYVSIFQAVKSSLQIPGISQPSEEELFCWFLRLQSLQGKKINVGCEERAVRGENCSLLDATLPLTDGVASSLGFAATPHSSISIEEPDTVLQQQQRSRNVSVATPLTDQRTSAMLPPQLYVSPEHVHPRLATVAPDYRHAKRSIHCSRPKSRQVKSLSSSSSEGSLSRDRRHDRHYRRKSQHYHKRLQSLSPSDASSESGDNHHRRGGKSSKKSKRSMQSRCPELHTGSKDRSRRPQTQIRLAPTTSVDVRPILDLDPRTRIPSSADVFVLQSRIKNCLKRFFPGFHLWAEVSHEDVKFLDCQNQIRQGWQNGDSISDRWLDKRMVGTLKARRFHLKDKVKNSIDVKTNQYVCPHGMEPSIFHKIVAELQADPDTPAGRRQRQGSAGTSSERRKTITNPYGQGGYRHFHASFVSKWSRPPTEEEEAYARRYSAKELRQKLHCASQGIVYKCDEEAANGDKEGVSIVGLDKIQKVLSQKQSVEIGTVPLVDGTTMQAQEDEGIFWSDGGDDAPVNDVVISKHNEDQPLPARRSHTSMNVPPTDRVLREGTRFITDTLRSRKKKASRHQ